MPASKRGRTLLRRPTDNSGGRVRFAVANRRDFMKNHRYGSPVVTLVAVALVLGLAGAALAADKPAGKPAEVSLTGDVQCAMCVMKKADAKDLPGRPRRRRQGRKDRVLPREERGHREVRDGLLGREEGRRDRDGLGEGREEMADRVEAGGREGLTDLRRGRTRPAGHREASNGRRPDRLSRAGSVQSAP